MANLSPTGLETITYGQQGWNAIVSANMQRLNGWIGTLLPLVDGTGKGTGCVPVWSASSGRWEVSSQLTQQQAAIQALEARIAALENK